MNRSVFYPRPVVACGPVSAVGQAGALLLGETVRASGLGTALSGALAAWRKPMAVHDPAKILLDVAVSLALGGEFCSDVGLLRAEPELFGRVASNPTISRTIDTLAGRCAAGGDGCAGYGRVVAESAHRWLTPVRRRITTAESFSSPT